MNTLSFERIVLEALLHYREVLLPGVCVLAFERHSAEIHPMGQAITPPYDTLEVYHPSSGCAISLLDLLMTQYGDQAICEQVYGEFISASIPDGQTLTINSVAIINLYLMTVVAIDPLLKNQLNPANPMYLKRIHNESEHHEYGGQQQQTPQIAPVQTRELPLILPQRAKREANNTSVLWIAGILSVFAALYLGYYFLLM